MWCTRRLIWSCSRARRDERVALNVGDTANILASHSASCILEELSSKKFKKKKPKSSGTFSLFQAFIKWGKQSRTESKIYECWCKRRCKNWLLPFFHSQCFLCVTPCYYKCLYWAKVLIIINYCHFRMSRLQEWKVFTNSVDPKALKAGSNTI